jgi:hypothetical protein
LAAKNQHVQSVNHCLNAASFFLSLEENSEYSLTPSQKKACLESALLQIYFAVIHYLNELLAYYQKPSSIDSEMNIESLMNEGHSLFQGVNEFSELRDWAVEKDSLFKNLCQLPAGLLSNSATDLVLQGNSIKNSNELKTGAKLIAFTQSDNHSYLFSIKTASLLKEQIQSIIERQRLNQSEY